MTTTSELPRPSLLRPDEVAHELRCSRSQVYELISRGEIPGVVRVGKSLRVSAKALDAWIDEQARPAPAA